MMRGTHAGGPSCAKPPNRVVGAVCRSWVLPRLSRQRSRRRLACGCWPTLAGPTTSLAAALADRPSHVSIFIGPEGGFTNAEEEAARGADARLISLGPRVLRTETASPLLAGLVLYELGDLSSTDDDPRFRAGP